MNNILFYGAGSIAEAIIHGLAKKSFIRNENIFVTNKQNKAKIQTLHTTYGVTPVENLETTIQQSDLIILAMKPKDVAEALEKIKKVIQPNTPILSIVAGYSMDSIAKIVQNRPLIRMMPNTSAQIGQSTTGVAFNEAVTNNLKKKSRCYCKRSELSSKCKKINCMPLPLFQEVALLTFTMSSKR
ncbi:pyrroline-5-carboxylate reductase family protein [Kurthia senegalensis]|uniref:pyrroline-5-carboxylate reductase family protein n=1 Tax=Kurthia senegalensis TaxID=1033740 RepID=UPI0002D30894|nr:NAD(P)-binding domain-containing protein [Kurthia senegalensis]